MDNSNIVSKLCSEIVLSNDLDSYLLDESVHKDFSKILAKRVIISKNAKKSVGFSHSPLKVASFSFHIENVFFFDDLENRQDVFENICEIIKKKEDEFKDKFTKMLNMQGFVQALVTSSLELKNDKASFVAVKIDSESKVKLNKEAILKIANRLKNLPLNEGDIICRWSENIFCLFIIPDNNYRRVIEVEGMIRESLSDLNVLINIGIHRLPKPLVQFNLNGKERTSRVLNILEHTSFRDLVVKTFKAMSRAIDRTFIVGNSVYKDLKTNKFIKAQRVPTDLLMKTVQIQRGG